MDGSSFDKDGSAAPRCIILITNLPWAIDSALLRCRDALQHGHEADGARLEMVLDGGRKTHFGCVAEGIVG